MISPCGNSFKYLTIDGERCVEFTTKGIYPTTVIVDRVLWEDYLQNYSWTGGNTSNDRIDAKATIDGDQWYIYKYIAFKQFSVLDSFNRTIHHRNNDPKDNRVSNLEPCNPIINSTETLTRKTNTGEQYILKQPHGGYKFECHIDKVQYYKNFSLSEYETEEHAFNAAIEYRNDWVANKRPRKLYELERKSRLVEFERGLRDMLKKDEQLDVVQILERHGVTVSFIERYS